MTQKEIAETLKQQPEIVELIKAYQDAKQHNPEGTRAALPVVLRILTRGPRVQGSTVRIFS